MERSQVLQVRDRFVRRGRIAWGVPMAIFAPIVVWHASEAPAPDLVTVAILTDAPGAGSYKAMLFFAALSSVTFLLGGQVWAELMWWLVGQRIVDRAEKRSRGSKGPEVEDNAN